MKEEYIYPSVWSFKGRVRRSAFISLNIASNAVIYILLAILGASNNDSVDVLLSLITLIATGIYIWIIAANAVKRVHDLNWPGIAALIALVPLVNLILLFMDGTAGPNKYGVSPKY